VDQDRGVAEDFVAGPQATDVGEEANGHPTTYLASPDTEWTRSAGVAGPVRCPAVMGVSCLIAPVLWDDPGAGGGRA